MIEFFLSVVTLQIFGLTHLHGGFRNIDDLLRHLWPLQVDDLFNDSFPDSLHWNAVNNFNGLFGFMSSMRIEQISPPGNAHDAEAIGLPQETSDSKMITRNKVTQKNKNM